MLLAILSELRFINQYFTYCSGKKNTGFQKVVEEVYRESFTSHVGESGVGCNIFVKYSYNSFNISDKIKIRILLNRHGSLQYMTLFSDGKEFCFRLY